jgi:hypothetical protein
VSRLSRQCGILNISQHYRPPRPVTGTALLFFLSATDENKGKSLKMSGDPTEIPIELTDSSVTATQTRAAVENLTVHLNPRWTM